MFGAVYFAEVAPGQSGTGLGIASTADTFTAGVLGDLAPWMDPAGSFNAYTTALAAMFETVYSIVVPVGSPDVPDSYAAGWSTLLNPSTCPPEFLPYCAAFIGVQIPSGSDTGVARAQIIAEKNFQTGTTEAIIGAAQTWLTGTQAVTILERQRLGGTIDAYWLVVVVRAEEVRNVTELTNAVNAVKPVGVQWTLAQADGTWSAAVHEWQQETALWNQASAIDP